MSEVGKNIASIIVKTCGLLLLVLGFLVALRIMHEALELYRDPAKIERLAVIIEKGSNLDKSLAPLRDNWRNSDQGPAGSADDRKRVDQGDNGRNSDQGPASSADARKRIDRVDQGVRLSYFVAWVVELLLLLLVARIALAAMKTGGELVLYRDRPRRE